MSNVSVSSLASVYDQLTSFANLSNFWSLFDTAFGSSYDYATAANFRSQWQSGNFSLFPQIEVVSGDVLGTANGAYAISTNRIYLSDRFVSSASQQSLEAVILEEIGHFVDAQVNATDTPGDEGELFSDLVRGVSVSDSELSRMKGENDWAAIVVNGQSIAVEQSITQIGTYDTPSYAEGVQVVGNYAYVADDYSGLQIINISNPAAPTLTGSYDTTGYAYGVQVVGNYAYVADAYSGLQIINISNPAAPTLAGSYDTTGYAYWVQVVGNYAYVADFYSGLQIINISNPAAPTLTGSYDTPSYAQKVQEVGNYAYVADSDSGLQIIDISNPAAPTLAGTYDTPSLANGVQVVGNYAYVADYDGGLKILDVSDFTSTPTTVNLAVAPTSVTEDGTTNLVYSFTRTGPTTNALTVNYSIAGTADATDYTGATPETGKTITFAAGSATATLTINPTADTTIEANETVALTLATGTGYTIGTTTAVTGTITNDDLPSINLSPNGQTAVEGLTSPQNLSYTVSLSSSSTQTITVQYSTANGTALAGSDYTATTGTLTFNPGVTNKTISIPILNNSVNEANETFTVKLTSPTNAILGGTATVTNTITDTLSASTTTTLAANVENLLLTGTTAIYGTGNAGNNVITGNSAANTLDGKAGIDTLTGGTGTDTFVFQFGQSLVANSDRITDFAIGTDKIDLLTQSGLATNAPTAFTRAVDSSAANLTTVVNNVFTDANGAIAGNQALAINSAALVKVTTTGITGTYLVVNDGTAGFQATNDLLINITGFTGTIPALGTIAVNSFFV
jgi:hypothetical protein